jgi:hypothetical protein
MSLANLYLICGDKVESLPNKLRAKIHTTEKVQNSLPLSAPIRRTNPHRREPPSLGKNSITDMLQSKQMKKFYLGIASVTIGLTGLVSIQVLELWPTKYPDCSITFTRDCANSYTPNIPRTMAQLLLFALVVTGVSLTIQAVLKRSKKK